MQTLLDFGEGKYRAVAPLSAQLLKWIGNKQRFAHEIVAFFPPAFKTYYEPFLGSAAVLATLAPANAVGTDVFPPLIEIWRTLHDNPTMLKRWYGERWQLMHDGDKVAAYEKVKAAYNSRPNGADLLFLCRACYGGVVRFRKADGHMSTPCGIHKPIPPEAFSRRVDEWRKRTRGTVFRVERYDEAMAKSSQGDLIYCDPPYQDSQSILYGAQGFDLQRLFGAIQECASRGVYVALSIDGTKRSGNLICNIPIPKGLFKREVYVNCGRSMLRRFQMEGRTLEGEVVADRLLLSY